MRSVFYETQIVFVKCSIFCIHLIDSANPVLTIFSVTFPSRLTTDRIPIIFKGNESEPSPRNQKHVKRTCAGHQVRILSLLLEKKWFSQKITFSTHRSMSRDVRASVAREFESATRDIPGVTLRPAEEANTAQ